MWYSIRVNKIKQHYPNFCEGFTPEVVSFSSTEELLNIPFVKKFSELPKFYRYSISSYKKYETRDLLMCELDEGYEWWVIGILENKENVNLPEWSAKYKAKNETHKKE